jgi:hypothetical protein
MVELVDRFQVDGELVNPVFVRAQNLMTIAVEGSEFLDILPHFFIGSMKDMRTVSMEFDAGGFICFGIAVASDMASFLDHKYKLIAVAGDPFCENSSQKSASDYHKGVILNIHLSVD